MRMARLDCDWHGENVRAFAAVSSDSGEVRPSWAFGVSGAGALLGRNKPADEDWWIVITGQHPQQFGPAAGRFFQGCQRRGIRILYYAFDEASRTMPCFPDIAPHLDILIHDESPLAEPGRSRLRAGCLCVHRSWVANIVPDAARFVERPEAKIVFLGSQLGLTAHRQRQIDHLRKRYGSRFVVLCDHSLSVADRLSLNRYQVSLCPEGRKFNVPAMSATHTDRPFWSGCLGMVPLAEDAQSGQRLEALHRAGLIVRYAHGDLDDLTRRCEQALATPVAVRRAIFEHFNRRETVGGVVAEAIAGFPAGS
jgi:hypothetical protein